MWKDIWPVRNGSPRSCSRCNPSNNNTATHVSCCSLRFKNSFQSMLGFAFNTHQDAAWAMLLKSPLQRGDAEIGLWPEDINKS